MMRLFVFALAFIFTLNSDAQSPKFRVINIPVEKNGALLRDPWVGGMDAPQFSECDLNQDGIPDLFIFDRVGQKVYTYLGNGGSEDTMFTYAPQYEALFPTGLNSWALIRDYNNDGIPDIFTSTQLGTRVFKGTLQSGLLHFELVSPFLSYGQSPYISNIFTLSTDIPVFTDVNGDGDMDILTYDIFGSTIGYYENQTSEHPGDPYYDIDSFRYAFITGCWGNMAQNLSSNSMTLHVDTTLCVYGALPPHSGGLTRHAGNSIYDVRDPVYNTVDLLNGNVGYNDLMFLRNNGQDALHGNIYEWDSIFPPCGTAMYIPSYPAGFGIHISSGTAQDVLMAPNVSAPFTQGAYPAQNTNNVMYFKNTGDTTCWYAYRGDSFLVHHLLDFGTNSKAVFYDFNGDGLPDIMVGNYGYYNPAYSSGYQGALAYYQNTGTATEPKFTGVTLYYDSLIMSTLNGISPAFSDLDGDGKEDMLIGDATGYLYFFKNEGVTGSSFPTMTSSQYYNINVGGYAAPFIYDLNGDSLNDLLVGRQDGGLSYYWNFGTKTHPVFSRDSVNNSFGNVNVTPAGGSIEQGFSQPFIMKDASGNLKLFVGSGGGTVYEYFISIDSLRGGTFELLDSNFLGYNTGQNTSISIADINNDGELEYLTGNAMGGLMMYSDSLWDPSTVLNAYDIAHKGQLQIYPNPASGYAVCGVYDLNFLNPKTSLYDVLGRSLDVPVQLSNGRVVLNTSRLSKGCYIVKITDAGKVYTGRVLIE